MRFKINFSFKKFLSIDSIFSFIYLLRKHFCSSYKFILLQCFIILLSACGANQTAIETLSQPDVVVVEDLHVVDCLLPGQVRMVGGRPYQTPRRPTITTAADCRLRGGEYVAYDRADYKTSLNVWLPSAERGDAEAQTQVGEIFERGLGGQPNYQMAIIWYQKAAEQGNSRAQFNLGTLYEQGKGVEKNLVLALNWYRKAWGLSEDNLIFQSAAAQQSENLRLEMEQLLNSKNAQIKALQNQVLTLQKRLSQQPDNSLNTELKTLQSLVEQLQSEKLQAEEKIAQIPKYRQPSQTNSTNDEIGDANPLSAKGLNFGKYFALIIGNDDYLILDDLDSPIKDAERASNLLKDKYGFSVKTLINADNVTIMRAINELNDQLTDKDNLLIFYAGHGSRVKTGNFVSGYWLPVNAEPPPVDTFWVSNEFVTRHLARLKAKRILVVADSCYAGLLSSAPGFLFMGDSGTYDENYMKYKLEKKSRLLIASGGDQPVLDNVGQGHSVFARAFFEELSSNNDVLTGPELFLKIRNRVTNSAATVGVDQQPEFKVIKGAGHEVGDFFFVPQSS